MTTIVLPIGQVASTENIVRVAGCIVAAEKIRYNVRIVAEIYGLHMVKEHCRQC